MRLHPPFPDDKRSLIPIFSIRQKLLHMEEFHDLKSHEILPCEEVFGE